MGKIIISKKGDGGDFQCGDTKAQDQINKAFELQAESPEDEIYLMSGKYVIDSPVLTSNVFEWTGDKDAVLTLANNVGWNKDIPLIKQKSVNKNDVVDITIENFTIDGNYAGNSSRPRGKSYHTLMWFFYGKQKIRNMTLQNGHNDGLKTMYADVIYENNKVYKLGHEAVYAIKCKSLLSQNNVVRTKTNSGTRAQDTNHVKILNNEIYTEFEEDAGGPGIQVQFTKSSACPEMNDVEISGNNIYNTYGPGIWLVAFSGQPYTDEEASGVWIHDNKFTGCGTHKTYNWLGGIETSGFYDTLIENNVFKGNYGAAVLIKNALNLKPNGKSGKYSTIVRDNQISDTIKMKCGVGGQGIRNETPDIHTVSSYDNYIWDNVSGPYDQVTSATDILHAPDEPEDPKKDSFLIFECTKAELSKIRNAYPKRTILRGL